MFRHQPVPILFKFPNVGIWPIHSLFVFFRFDAVYIDPEKRVAEILPEIPSWKLLIMPKCQSLYLLELPPGQSRKLSVGDKLEW
jgi:uncharacterized membrane protein (UPF0127 family)